MQDNNNACPREKKWKYIIITSLYYPWNSIIWLEGRLWYIENLYYNPQNKHENNKTRIRAKDFIKEIKGNNKNGLNPEERGKKEKERKNGTSRKQITKS